MECENIKHEFYIPVEPEIEKFINHLRAHDRTILSAKFGDGKSFFIDRLTQNEEFNSEFIPIKIYPVNYQVEDNEDIFELVKRDVLLQMILNGMIKDDYEISDSVALAYWLQRNGENIVDSALPFIAQFFEGLTSTTAVTVYKATKIFNQLREKVQKFKNEYSESEEVNKFLSETKGIPSIECDAVTMIIRENIESFRLNKKKKVVLFVEDMDRMDPAHLFRILNILSAHIDYSYSIGVRPDESLVGNKFGLDHIVLVLDYDNLKSIFHHIYGPDTDFNGYIYKFSPTAYFRYSFPESRNNLIREAISRQSGMEMLYMETLFDDSLLNKFSIRVVSKAIRDAHRHVSDKAYRSKSRNGENYIASKPILMVMAILRQLKVNDDSIMNSLIELVRESASFLKYLTLSYLMQNRSIPGSIVLSLSNHEIYSVDYTDVDNNGVAIIRVSAFSYYGGNSKELPLFLEPLFEYIAE